VSCLPPTGFCAPLPDRLGDFGKQAVAQDVGELVLDLRRDLRLTVEVALQHAQAALEGDGEFGVGEALAVERDQGGGGSEGLGWVIAAPALRIR
jgi:hypothetical protein